jgi:hypothetical protein
MSSFTLSQALSYVLTFIAGGAVAYFILLSKHKPPSLPPAQFPQSKGKEKQKLEVEDDESGDEIEMWRYKMVRCLAFAFRGFSWSDVGFQ